MDAPFKVRQCVTRTYACHCECDLVVGVRLPSGEEKEFCLTGAGVPDMSSAVRSAVEAFLKNTV